jgi:hypothetical protein
MASFVGPDSEWLREKAGGAPKDAVIVIEGKRYLL